jgi:hypothetical protein
MAKRLRVTETVEDDILDRLRALHRQATAERSHYYSRQVRERCHQRDHGEAGAAAVSKSGSTR